MATITRGDVTLTPRVLLPARLTRATRTVVHELLGAGEVEITARPHGPRAGELRALWPTEADALDALDALAVVGGPWTFTGAGWSLVAHVVGDLDEEALTEWGGTWELAIGVQEAAS